MNYHELRFNEMCCIQFVINGLKMKSDEFTAFLKNKKMCEAARTIRSD